MSAFEIILISIWGTAFLCGLLATALFRSNSNSGWIDFFGPVLSILCCLAVVLGICVPLITLGGRAYGRNACTSYQRNTGRVTKFVVLNSVDTGTCMTRTADDKWVSIDNLRLVAK